MKRMMWLYNLYYTVYTALESVWCEFLLDRDCREKLHGNIFFEHF